MVPAVSPLFQVTPPSSSSLSPPLFNLSSAPPRPPSLSAVQPAVYCERQAITRRPRVEDTTAEVAVGVAGGMISLTDEVAVGVAGGMRRIMTV